MNSVDLTPVFDFLTALQGHNDKAWFDEHRADYELARERFESFVDQLIFSYGSVEDLGGITAKDCVMRIYRDTRFSKDKSPYKTNMGATIAPGGKKSTRLGYHLHLQPERTVGQLNGTTRPRVPVFLGAGLNVISAANGSVSTDHYVRDGGSGSCVLP